MRKYLFLQGKRVARFWIWGLCVVLVLFGCLAVIYQTLTATEENQAAEEAARMRLGVVGTAQDQYLQWGLAAMQLDSTAMSIELIPMEEADAIDALTRGDISAYFIFPENFVDDAMGGDVHKLRFVSTAGAAGLLSIVKEEIVSICDSILIACESGSYGVGDALWDQNLSSGGHIDALALEYVDMLLDRSKMYTVEEVPQNRLPFSEYMLGGMTVVLLMLTCLPFAPLYIRSDRSLDRVLRARRIGVLAQVGAEFVTYCGALTALLLVVSCVLYWGGLTSEGVGVWSVFAGILPAVMMMAALSYCIYSMSDHLIGGVLLAFLAILALCFIGGCLYPIHFFPESIQRAAKILPTGIARECATNCLLGAETTGNGPLLAYTGGCLAVAVLIRYIRTGRVRG